MYIAVDNINHRRQRTTHRITASSKSH